MSDNDKRIITPGAHPFSRMNRAATRQEAVNAAVNSAQGVYDLLSEDHNRIMEALFADEIEPLKREFKEFREIAARRIRELERRSLSYLVLTAIKVDWMRFRLWLIELRAPVLDRLPADMADAIEEQRAGVLAGVENVIIMPREESIDLLNLGPPEEMVHIEPDGTIHSEPIVAPKKAEG